MWGTLLGSYNRDYGVWHHHLGGPPRQRLVQGLGNYKGFRVWGV